MYPFGGSDSAASHRVGSRLNPLRDASCRSLALQKRHDLRTSFTYSMGTGSAVCDSGLCMLSTLSQSQGVPIESIDIGEARITTLLWTIEV